MQLPNYPVDITVTCHWYVEQRSCGGTHHFRRLWIDGVPSEDDCIRTQRINAGARMNGITYNRLIHGLKLAEVEVDRKILAELAVSDFAAFSALCEVAKNALPEDVNAPKNAA